MKSIMVAVLAVLAFLAISTTPGQHGTEPALATNPVGAKPLLGCPDIDGTGDVDLFEDIFGVANVFGLGPGDAGYHVLYDVAPPVNQAIDLFEDIFGVAGRFGEVCPAADSEVARATHWGIDNAPAVQNDAAIAAIGYRRGSTDVPGQGVHYIKLQNWDGTFDPAAPEGLVYDNGKLAAQLYVVDGGAVGWGTHAATSCCPTAPHDVDLEGDIDGPGCDPACSWTGPEGWHLHYYLCTAHIGTVGAAAVPGLSLSSCASFAGAEPVCSVPITTTPCYRWAQNVGWMGHLWNHQLNPNVIPDVGGTNGRFADCTPDGGGWKAFNCPA